MIEDLVSRVHEHEYEGRYSCDLPEVRIHVQVFVRLVEGS